MHDLVSKYLILHKKLTIPQIGNFSVETGSASIDRENGMVLPPETIVKFIQGAGEMADKQFFQFLSDELALDEVAAIRAFHEFSANLRDTIQNHHTGILPGIGHLSLGAEGEFVFIQENGLPHLPAAIPLGVAMQESMQEKIQKDEYWLFFAIILLILGIGALLYYYYW